MPGGYSGAGGARRLPRKLLSSKVSIVARTAAPSRLNNSPDAALDQDTRCVPNKAPHKLNKKEKPNANPIENSQPTLNGPNDHQNIHTTPNEAKMIKVSTTYQLNKRRMMRENGPANRASSGGLCEPKRGNSTNPVQNRISRSSQIL